jgi:hypothetical protein
MRLTKIAMLAATLLPLMSYAALGGAPSPATQPVAPAGANQRSASAQTPARYTVRQSVDANGVTVREYVLPANVVFAVTWDGPVLPNMRALLGSYFANFATAGTSGTAGASGPGPRIEGSDAFRIESAGRLGQFFGMAWVPRLLPAGVSASDLQ